MMPPLWVTLALSYVGLIAWDVRRIRRERHRAEFAATCRKFDEAMAPQGFVPESFDTKEATWRRDDGTVIAVGRKRR